MINKWICPECGRSLSEFVHKYVVDVQRVTRATSREREKKSTAELKLLIKIHRFVLLPIGNRQHKHTRNLRLDGKYVTLTLHCTICVRNVLDRLRVVVADVVVTIAIFFLRFFFRFPPANWFLSEPFATMHASAATISLACPFVVIWLCVWACSCPGCRQNIYCAKTKLFNSTRV